MEQFFLRNSKFCDGMGLPQKMNKEGFLICHLLKVLKLPMFVLFSFFYYFKYYGQNIFSWTTVPYVRAKVERKNKLFIKIWN